MDMALSDALLSKILAITQGPHREIFERFVDLLYDQEEYFSPQDLAEIEAAEEAVRRGEVVAWKDLKKELGL